MANDLSNTPAPPTADLAASLQRWHPTLAGTLESEDALPFLRPDEAQRLARIIAPHVEPASEDDLLMALIWLASVTTGDKLRDPDMMRASARALVSALREYPADAALSAIKDWPKAEGGKWWPTENELRAEADKRSASRTRLRDHVRHHAEQVDPRAPRRTEPFGKTAEFVKRVREVWGDPYVRSWLTGTTCQFEDAVIWTTPYNCGRLHNAHSVMLFDLGVKILSDDQSRAHFQQQTQIYEVIAAEKAPKKRKRGGEW